MRKFLGLVGVVMLSIVLGSCEGPDGPQGPPGYSVFPLVVEYKQVNFDTSPGRKHSEIVFQNIKEVDLGLGDSVFVFFLDDVNKNGPVWRMLPATYYITLLSENTSREISIEYFSRFSPTNVIITAQSADYLSLFKGGPKDLSFTDDLTFRIVYVPGSNPIHGRAASTSSHKQDKTITYDELVERYSLKESDVKHVAL